MADVVIAETGSDMSRFLTAGHVASWAGTCPGSNESAGRIKPNQTRPGNPYPRGASGIAAMSAYGSKDAYKATKFHRIASRRGPVKAIVALGYAMFVAIWHMVTTGTPYGDPGGPYFIRLNPDRSTRPMIGGGRPHLVPRTSLHAHKVREGAP